MIKILYFTDSHLRGTNPRARTDNYLETMKNKFREIFSLAVEKECDAIICGGDLFDRPDTAYAVAGEFAELFITSCLGVPFYVCPGNHDIYGYNLDTLPRTILGLFAQFGIIEILDRKPVNVPKRFNLGNHEKIAVYLTGQGFYHDMDRSPADYQTGRIAHPDRYKTYHVHVVHGMLVENPLPYEVAHTLIENVKTDADVILSGHEHTGYGLRLRPDNIWFCNPGALGRVSAKAKEMHRPVQVAVFAFTRKGVSAELIPLQSARTGIEVLSREHLDVIAGREERMGRFLSLLAAEGESKFLEVRDIVHDISRREILPKEVIKEALDRIARARESLGKSISA